MITHLQQFTSLSDRPPLFPPAVSAFLKSRMIDAIGGALIMVGVLMALACLTYTPSDPSLNTATGISDAHNFLGVKGGFFADFMVQWFGIACYLPPVILSGWGMRVILRLPIKRIATRLTGAGIVTLFGAAALAITPEHASRTVGLDIGANSLHGGAAGLLLLDWISSLMPGAWQEFSGFWATGLATTIAVILFFPVMGYSYLEWLRGTHRTYRHALRTAHILLRFPLWAAHTLRHPHERRPLLLDKRWESDGENHHHTDEDIYEDEDEGDTDGENDTTRRPRQGIFSFIHRSNATEDADATGSASSSPHGSQKHTIVNADSQKKSAIATTYAAARRRKRSATGSISNNGRTRKVELNDGEIYEFPSLELLGLPDDAHIKQQSPDQLEEIAVELMGALNDYGVDGKILKASPGPVVTLYELEPAPGTKSARVIGLSDDIARQMSAISVRVATVPGRNVLGIELPNKKREIVYLRELLAHTSYARSTAKLPLSLGKDIGGEPVVADLARMPHLLVAGTTGSGKSVSVNTMILSLLYRMTPEQVRLIMIDPKMLELSIYEGIPHLLAPVVTDPKKAVVALKWTVREMEDRYRAMSKLGVRNIDGYNQRIREARENGEILSRRIQTGFDADTGKPVFEDQPIDLVELPYIVVIVDEMADLMLVAGKDIEAAIQRLAQMARAAGIHIIMATQRPSVDVITGTIKANFPTRISFQVTSRIDSRTILNEQGAEQLLGQGDMLYMAGGGRLTRVHGAFASDHEVEEIVRHLRMQGEPSYLEAVTLDAENGEGGFGTGEGEGEGDELYDRAVQIVLRERKASTSYIQRCLQIGYNRAARLIERMETEGLVSPANHVGKREILVPGESAR